MDTFRAHHAELIPHTDGTSLPDPPGLLLLTCQQPASHGGNTLLADAAHVTAALAGQHPVALRALEQDGNAARPARRPGRAGHRR
jgi:alpha-ketoglutarate-dependent taurine dioxygenase